MSTTARVTALMHDGTKHEATGFIGFYAVGSRKFSAAAATVGEQADGR